MTAVDAAGPLFDMLRSGDAPAAEAAAWLLGYCATDPPARRILSELGAATALMPVRPQTSLRSTSVWFLLPRAHRLLTCSSSRLN